MKIREAKSATSKSLTSASQKVEAALKRAIYRGQLHPRERIIEDDLARQLHVSRGTVREALLRLERDGLVVTTSRRGTFIRDISLEDLGVFFTIRGKLEGLSVRYMRERMTPDAKRLLNEEVRKLKAAVAQNDDEQFFYADMHLHQTIWKLSGQPQLYRTLHMIMNPFISLIARFYSSRFSLTERFEGHRKYVKMVLSSPINRVEDEVEAYFDTLYQDVFRSAIPTFSPAAQQFDVRPESLEPSPIPVSFVSSR